jgi:hypothetical protein
MGLLSSAGSILGGAALVGGILGLGGVSQGTEGKGASKLAQQIAKFQLQQGQAISDTNNPLFQNLNAAAREQASKDFQAGLQAALNADLRNRAIGGPGYTTVPNRRDENFWRAIATERELGGQAAAESARKTLSDAASAAGGGGSTAVGASQTQSNIGQSQRDVLGSAVLGGNAVLGGIESLFPKTFGTAPTTRIGGA